MTKEDTLLNLETLSDNLGQLTLSKRDTVLNNKSLNKNLYTPKMKPENIHLKLEALNNSLIPSIHQYKNLQQIYLMAVNKGGCFITIDGKCEGDDSKSKHPYFYDILQQDSLENCIERKDEWKKKCNNKNVDSLYVDKTNQNIYKKTKVIRDQLDRLNCKIIYILMKMKPLVKQIQSFEDSSLYKETKITLLDDINKMMDQRKSLAQQLNGTGDSLIKKLYSNYSKYIYSVCLVIFLLIVLFYCLRTNNLFIGELIVFLIIIFIFWDKINYYIFKFFKRKLF